MRHIKYILLNVFLFVTLVVFQNCAPAGEASFSGSQVQSSSGTVNPNSSNQNESPSLTPSPNQNSEPNPPLVLPADGTTTDLDPNPMSPAPETPTPDPTPEPEPNPEPPETAPPSSPGTGSTETTDCKLYVSPNGNDSRSGNQKNPLKLVSTAIKKANNRGTICFLAGSYPTITLRKINAPKDNPLVLTAAPEAKDKVIIQGTNVGRDIGIAVYSSSNIYVSGFSVKKLQKGITFFSVTGGEISNNKIENVGLEAIHVGAYFNYSTRKFEDGPSSYVEVTDNKIDGAGYRYESNGERGEYGEGIYIGTGAQGGDKTHHILVKGNWISDTSAEPIEIKPFAQYVEVSNNTIEDSSIPYSGAITIAVGNTSIPDSHCKVLNNTIRRIKARRYTIGGIVVGNGTTEVSGNTISGIDGGRGIRIYKSFQNANARKVIIKNNTLYGAKIAINDGNGGYPGLSAIVEKSGNRELP